MSLPYPHPSLARITAVGLAFVTLVAVSACDSQPVAGAITRPSDSPTTVSSATGSPSPASPTPTAPAPAQPTRTTRPTTPVSRPTHSQKPAPALVLAPSGIGGLSLGMSKSAALATGMVAGPDVKVQGSTDCRVYDGRHGVALVYFSGGKVEIITGGSSIQTDKGVGVGDTYLRLHQQYPDALDSDDEGRAYGVASGAPIKAHYRFGISGHGYPDSKITSLALQGDDQPCYE